MEEVILVDESDIAVGAMEKMEAHRLGMLHRAFSVLIFNSSGEMLLQKRALSKYHSGGLWTNACCSHPSPNESMESAVRKRVHYEMGIDVKPWFLFKFIYRAPLDHGLTEHELDHVFAATFNGTPVVNPTEVDDWKYADARSLREDMAKNPGHYTVWFRDIIGRLQRGDVQPGSVNVLPPANTPGASAGSKTDKLSANAAVVAAGNITDRPSDTVADPQPVHTVGIPSTNIVSIPSFDTVGIPASWVSNTLPPRGQSSAGDEIGGDINSTL